MRRNLRMAVVISLVLGPSGVALADLESDFKDAVSKEGCESIPYSDLRGNCTSQQTGVTDWCKNSSRPVTCGSESITRDLKKKVEVSNKNVDNL